MPEADNSETLRVGGWIPPYTPSEQAQPIPARRRRPVLPGGPAPVPAPLAPYRAARLPYLVLAGACAVAVLGYVATAVILNEDVPEPALPPVQALAPASPPVSIEPAPPTGRPATSGPRIRPISDENRRPATTSRRPSAPASSRPTTPPPAVTPVVGSTVGLSPVGWPDNRVRNRNLLARLEWVTADSPAADRMEAEFLVRAGQARAGCLSFESAAHPGYFLRHRDFVLRLEPAQPTDLYRQDVTFCAALTGGGFVLRSTNYPDHHLRVVDGLLRLERSTPGEATAFRAVPPL